jgi:nitroreductase
MNHTSAIIESLLWRRAVKNFDPSRTIPADTWQTLEQSLVLSPSSYGLQPWKFFVITSPAIKQLLPDASWGQPQPRDCSHFVVIAARRTVDAGFVQAYIDRIAAVRGVPPESLTGLRDAVLGKVSRMGNDQLPWTSRQCYIALGFLLETAALLGVDACPMEGVIPDRLDGLLAISGTPWTSVVACALGYRSTNDTSASEAKVRFDVADVIVRC